MTHSCPSCEREFSTDTGVKVHHTKTHGESLVEVDNSGDFSCPSCERNFDSKRAVSLHHYRTHDESIAMESSVCETCGEEFDYYPTMQHGEFCSDACTGKARTGENNPNYGEGLTGKDNPMYGVEHPMKGEEASKSAIEAMKGPRPSMRGEKHPNWKGGYEDYYGPSWTEELREKIRDRDDRICTNCGAEECELSRKLDVHHIIPFESFGIEAHETANEEENLRSLCRKCHITVERSQPTET